MSGEGEDFCEYVYNPLMRQYQAMMRLLQMLRGSQTTADCNDIQCFTTDNDPSNPMNALNPGGQMSFMATYGPMLLVWALFIFALIMFRPSSMRGKKNPGKKNGSERNLNDHVSNRLFNNDDDDNSTVS